jgi:hypothetical protein
MNNSDSNIVGISLLSTDSIFEQKSIINQLLQIQVINQGLPLFVWIICDELEQLQLKEELTQTVLTKENLMNLDGLLAIIKNKRSERRMGFDTYCIKCFYRSKI